MNDLTDYDGYFPSQMIKMKDNQKVSWPHDSRLTQYFIVVNNIMMQRFCENQYFCKNLFYDTSYMF